jgi:hypothetical protein
MKTRHNTTVREAGERWLESSELNEHTQAACQQTLLQYVLKHDLWDITLADLNHKVLEIDRRSTLNILFKAPHKPTFVDLREIPREAWEEFEFANLIIPEEIIKPYLYENLTDAQKDSGTGLTVEQKDALAIAVEEFYGITSPFYADYDILSKKNDVPGVILKIEPSNS